MRFIKLLLVFVLLFIGVNSHASSVTIDTVHGTWNDNGIMRIMPDEEISFDIRIANNSGYTMSVFANGYRVWTSGGTNFEPVSINMLDPLFPNLFDHVFGVIINSDGIGTDTVGVGGSGLMGFGIPDGYDTLTYRIITGGVQEGETLCIDSSFFGLAGTWKWAGTGGDVYPDWSGQICLTAVCPPSCIPPSFTNNIDTIKSSSCEKISFHFDAQNSELTISDVRYFIIDGPGSIDSLTGLWTYTIPSQESGGYDTLIVGSYDLLTCKCNIITSSSVLYFRDIFPADINDDCRTDISDLVWLVQYLFNSGLPPSPLMSADLNGDSEIDISDLVWMANYMFRNGPPPIG